LWIIFWSPNTINLKEKIIFKERRIIPIRVTAQVYLKGKGINNQGNSSKVIYRIGNKKTGLLCELLIAGVVFSLFLAWLLCFVYV